MAVNHLRGEIEIKLANQSFIMRPTFDAMCRIENYLNKSIIILLTNLEERGLLIEELIQIIRIGINAAGVPINNEDVKELLEQSDIMSVTEQVCLFLQNGLGIDTKS